MLAQRWKWKNYEKYISHTHHITQISEGWINGWWSLVLLSTHDLWCPQKTNEQWKTVPSAPFSNLHHLCFALLGFGGVPIPICHYPSLSSPYAHCCNTTTATGQCPVLGSVDLLPLVSVSDAFVLLLHLSQTLSFFLFPPPFFMLNNY